MNSLPSKQDIYYIIEMLQSKLIDYTYIQPWADNLIENLSNPQKLLIDLSSATYQGEIINILKEYVYYEPFKEQFYKLVKFHIACLWLRYERRELSWATLLNEIGKYLDIEEINWDCETPYHFLNTYENSYFSEKVEQETKQKYLQEHNILHWIEIVDNKRTQLHLTNDIKK